MSYTLGKSVQKTEKNAHWWAEKGLIKDLNLFFKTHPEDFYQEKNYIKTIIYLALTLLCGFVLYQPTILQNIPQMASLGYDDLGVRAVFGVVLVIVLFAWFLSDEPWINLKTGGKIKNRVVFHRLSQYDYSADEITQMFKNRDFDAVFGLENDEESNVWLHIDEDKK